MISNLLRSSTLRLCIASLAVLVGFVALAQAPDGTATFSSNPMGDIQFAAQPLDPVKAKATSQAAIDAFDKVVVLANKAIDSIRSDKGLAKYGERLTLSLTGIVIIWSFLKNLLLKQSFQQLFGDLIFPIVIASFVLGPGLQKLPSVIESTTTAIASSFSPGYSSDSFEKKIAGSMITSALKIWNADNGSGIGAFIGAPLVTIVQFLLRMVVILLIMVCAALAVAALLIAKFQIALAIGLAPLLIPWLVFKPTEFLFSGWLSFLLKAGFGLVGVLAVGAVVSDGAAAMSTMISTMPTSDEGAMTYAVMAGMSIIFAFLMLKASDIGSGVISGSATGIGGISAVAKGAAVMTPFAMAGAAAGAMGSAARVGAAGAAGKALSGSDQKPGKMSGMAQMAKAAIAGRSPLANAAFSAGHGTSPKSAPSTPAKAPHQSLAAKLRERNTSS